MSFNYINRKILILVLACAAVIAFAVPSQAASPATIHVFPALNAINNALNKAKPGDTLVIHAGTYQEVLKVAKHDVIIKADGDGEAIVDAKCKTDSAITLQEEGIVIQGLTVRGGRISAIDVEHRKIAYLRDNTLEATCKNASYGINIIDGGSLHIVANTASGYAGAGYYIGSIKHTPDGALLAKDNVAFNNTRGMFVENSSTGLVKLKTNNVHDNLITGILVHNSNHIYVEHGTVINNGTVGIDLDSTATNAKVANNTLSGQTTDILNEGTGNCFKNNTYTTSSGSVTTC